jgi:hypothetical protein
MRLVASLHAPAFGRQWPRQDSKYREDIGSFEVDGHMAVMGWKTPVQLSVDASQVAERQATSRNLHLYVRDRVFAHTPGLSSKCNSPGTYNRSIRYSEPKLSGYSLLGEISISCATAFRRLVVSSNPCHLVSYTDLLQSTILMPFASMHKPLIMIGCQAQGPGFPPHWSLFAMRFFSILRV